MKFYHYVHCPFCVRVRMAMGFLKINYESVVLPYHDEETPLRLTQVKMLPIIEVEGRAFNESLDIIEFLDKKKSLSEYTRKENSSEINELLSRIGSDVHSLAMPYWIWTPEFNDESRAYFQKKKELKRGPFKDLVYNKNTHIKNLEYTLKDLEKELKPFYQSSALTLLDIMIASHLWGMYIVPEFQFSSVLNNYLQAVGKECGFNYHIDFWR